MPANEPMRCSILGNAGGGKSILARALARRAGLPLHELEAWLWTDNWQAAPAESVRTRHDEVLAQERWVIDGFGWPELVEARLARSTHVVLVDLPIWLHFALASERQWEWKAGRHKHPPGGMATPPPTKRLFELMWRIHTELMPRVRERVDAAADAGARVEVVSSTERLRELQFDPSRLVG